MLLRNVEKFLRETGMPWTRFGRLAAQDPRFVEDLRNGRTPRPRTEAKVAGFMTTWRENTAHRENKHA